MKNCNRCGKFRSQKNHVCLPVKVMKNGKVDYTFTMTPNIKGRMSRSERKKRTTKRPSRFISGAFVGLSTLAVTFFGLTSYANFEMPKSEVMYQAPQTASSTSTIAPKEPVVVKPETIKEKPTPEEFKAYFISEAKKAGVWVEKAEHMMKVESGGWNPHARGDQKVLANGNGMCRNKKSPLYGKPANARGGAQITECWFPSISDEQADDYKFATKFMLDTILSGKEKCRTIYSTCDAWYELQK